MLNTFYTIIIVHSIWTSDLLVARARANILDFWLVST